MTQMGLDYLKYQETERSNLARERETNRSNLANETETHRANLARELETNRSNLVKEAENVRHNTETEKETKRSNLAREVETNRSNLAHEEENVRSNKAREEDADLARDQEKYLSELKEALRNADDVTKISVADDLLLENTGNPIAGMAGPITVAKLMYNLLSSFAKDIV